MPWQSEAMKDVVICEKLGGVDKQALIPRCPNGETHSTCRVSHSEYIAVRRRTRGTETSKYPEEKKSTEIPKVAASEIGLALKLLMMQVKSLESLAIQGDSPVTDTS